MPKVDIYKSRMLLGLTQQQMADKLGLSVRQIANLENGTTPLKKYLMIALESLIEKNAMHKRM